MTTILHPTSFADEENTAFETALAITLATGGQLVLVHVFGDRDPHLRDPDWSQFPHVRQRLYDWGRIDFALPANQLRQAAGISVKKLSLAGRDPAAAMADYLEEADVDLVVMATRGGGWSQWVQPSQAGRLASAIRQPVLFVRHGIDGPHDAAGRLTINSVLVPVDNEPDPQMAVDALGGLANWFGSAPSMRAVHAGDGPLHLALAPPAGHEARFFSDWSAGSPEDVIEKAARETDADLIVMTRAGPSGVIEKLTGSTTTQVIARCDCPVLTVPAPSYD